MRFRYLLYTAVAFGVLFSANLEAHDGDLFLKGYAALKDPGETPEMKLLILDLLYGQKHRLIPLERELLLQEAESMARDPFAPQEAVAGAIHVMAGLLEGQTDKVGYILETAGNTRKDARVRSAAVRALGDLKVERGVSLFEQIIEDPRNPPELKRSAALSLLSLNGKASFPSITRLLFRTKDESVSSTAQYCLSRIKTPESLAALVRYDGHYTGFALANMEEVVLEVLQRPNHTTLEHAIRATRYLQSRERYAPLLYRLAEAGNLSALDRLIEMAGALPFEEEKEELRELLTVMNPEFSGRAAWIHGRLSAAALPPAGPVPPSGYAQVSIFSYGNTTGQEYGDPVYRVLLSSSIPGIPNYNHTGLFYGLDGSSALRAIHAPGLGETCTEVSFVSEYFSHGSDYYGAFTVQHKILGFADRRAICQTAWELEAASMPYNLFNALLWKGADFDGTVADIDSIRCEGVVEYCYERQGIKMWWNKTKPAAEWDITAWPDVQWHNDWPDFSLEPDRELSPWAQRGAPRNTGPVFSGPHPLNAMLTFPSPARLPKYEVTQVSGVGYADVTIKAFDASGIHKITAVLPGSGSPLVDVNAQHPAVNSFSVTHRVYTEGTLQYKAMDNGGNGPASYLDVYVEID